MQGLELLNMRLRYQGGNQEQRMQKDKLNSLKKALLYSYQAETIAILPEWKEFRCLINSNKLKPDYDNKILSIPYEDICLGKLVEETDIETGKIRRIRVPNKPNGKKMSESLEPTGIKCGDIIYWTKTGTYWIVFMQFLEEDSYFRGELYKCEGWAEIGTGYPVYIRGPVETTIQWNQKAKISWNDMNYSLVMYISKNEETENFFSRFTKVKIDDKWWEAKVVNSYTAENIIEVTLGEWFTDKYAESDSEDTKEPDLPQDDAAPAIQGVTILKPYDVSRYIITNIKKGGTWKIDNAKKAKIKEGTNDSVIIEVVTGKSGSFNLSYKIEDKELILPIKVESL